MSFMVAVAPDLVITVFAVTLKTRAPTLTVFAFWSTAEILPRKPIARLAVGCAVALGEGDGVLFGDGEVFAFGDGVTLGLAVRVGDFLMAADDAAQAIAAKQATRRRNLFFISGVD